MNADTRKSIPAMFVLAALVTVGCAAAQPRQHPATQDAAISKQNDAIRPVVEKLALNATALSEAYDDIHKAALGALQQDDPDRQLNYVQKAYLHVHGAVLVAEYQYRMLSVIHYVRPERRTDYLSLQVRGLDTARSRMADTMAFVDLYDAFITHPESTAAIARARELIQGNVYLYEQLMGILKPLVPPAKPFTKDPFNPI